MSGEGRRDTLVPYVLDALSQRHARFTLREPFRIRRLPTPELIRLAFRIARELEARGLSKGERILVWGHALPEWVAAFLGALLKGVVVVPLDDAAGCGFARAVAETTKARLAAVARDSLDAAREAFGDSLPLLVLEELPELVAERSAEPPEPVELGPKDPVEIVFTSGTTSEPKGVVLSHRNVLQNLQALEPHYRRWEGRLGWLVHRRPVVTVLPLSHAFGQVVGIFAPLLMELSPVFVSPPGPSAVREAIRAEKALAAIAVPRILSGLRRALETEARKAGRLEALREKRERLEGAGWLRRRFAFRRLHRELGRRFLGFIVGGAALDPEEERAWKSMGVLAVQGYGLTETAPIVAVSTPFARGVGAVGHALGDQEVRLGADGEVLVRGSNVAEGYLKGGKLQSLTDEDGWFHTGDLGEWDDHGRLVIKGRSKDVIVTANGLNVYPRDLESALGAQEGVLEAAVVGRPAGDGEQVHAVLLLEPSLLSADEAERERVAEAAVRAANERLPAYQRVRSHSVWPQADFPRTAGTQKVLKRELLASLDGGPPARGSAVDETLRAFLRRDDGALPEDRKLSDLDLSSLDVLELLARVESEGEVQLDETRVGAETTVGELRRLVEGGGGEGARLVQPRMPRWALSPLAGGCGSALRAGLAGPVLALWCPLRVEGREHLDALGGPALFIGNHSSYLDAPVVFKALPGPVRRRVSTAMATEPFHPLFTTGGSALERAWQRLQYGLAVLAFGAFPMPRGSGFRPSLGYAAELVDRGRHLLVFPEGRMSLDGELQDFRGGVALLATRLGIPVVPFRIEGLHEVLPPQASWPKRGQVRVVFGGPLRFAEDAESEKVTRELERAVREA